MRRTTKYVALDVHQATTSATVREEGGLVIARSILPTTAPTWSSSSAGCAGRFTSPSKKERRRRGCMICSSRSSIASSSPIVRTAA